MNEELTKALSGIKDLLDLTQDYSILILIANLLIGAFLALYLRFLYSRFGASASDADSFTRVFPILTLVTTGVIVVVKSSLALSLGLVGALSIVRFRAAIKEPEELVYLFLCIAIGLSLGAQQAPLAISIVLVASVFIIGMHLFSGKNKKSRMLLTISGNSEKYFSENDSNLLNFVRDNVKGCKLQRMDVESGEGSARFLLGRSNEKSANEMIRNLQSKYPDCEISFVNLDLNI